MGMTMTEENGRTTTLVTTSQESSVFESLLRRGGWIRCKKTGSVTMLALEFYLIDWLSLVRLSKSGSLGRPTDYTEARGGTERARIPRSSSRRTAGCRAPSDKPRF